MSVPVSSDLELQRVSSPVEPQAEPVPPHCKGVAQLHLQQFMVSLWLHFFRRQRGDIDEPWKECGRRRRRDFFKAGLHEARDFASYITSHGPDTQRAQLAAVVHSRLERSITGETCSPPPTDQVVTPR